MRIKGLMFLFFIVGAAAGFAQSQKSADKWAKFEGSKVRYYDTTGQLTCC